MKQLEEQLAGSQAREADLQRQLHQLMETYQKSESARTTAEQEKQDALAAHMEAQVAQARYVRRTWRFA